MITEMMSWQPTVALVIFLVAYAIWMTEQLNRALVALIAAVLFLLLGVVQWRSAFQLHIQWDTLLLWAGLLVMAAIMGRSGSIHRFALVLIRYSGRRPALLYLYMMLLAGVGAALLEPVTMMLILVPIMMAVAKAFRLSAAPFLIGSVLATNIGGTATLIGQPANIWIGTSNTELDFVAFVTALGPIVGVLFILNIVLVWLCYCKILRIQPSVLQPEQSSIVPEIVNPSHSIVQRAVVPVLYIGVIILLVWASQLGWESGWIAAGGAVVLLIAGKWTSGIRPSGILKQLEWDTLLFFAGLFILAGGLIQTGWITEGATYLIELTNGNMGLVAMILLWVTGLLSMTMDHMPWIAAAIPLIQETGQQMEASSAGLLHPLWWALALGAGIGGSGTLLGSAAGLIAASIAEREGQRLRYIEFLRIALPLTLLSLVLASLYLMYVLMPSSVS